MEQMQKTIRFFWGVIGAFISTGSVMTKQSQCYYSPEGDACAGQFTLNTYLAALFFGFLAGLTFAFLIEMFTHHSRKR